MLTAPDNEAFAEVWVAAETGRVCYTEADVAKMKAAKRGGGCSAGLEDWW